MKSRKQTDRAFILGRMKLLLPLVDLGPDILGKLLENAQITHYPGGLHYLIPAGQGREYVYLLDGSLIVYRKGNPKIGISADDTAARLPICEAYTDEVKVIDRKKCRILRFNRYIYDILTTHSDDMSIEVEESGDETHALFVEIYQAYIGGYLKVPSLPGLALRIRKAG